LPRSQRGSEGTGRRREARSDRRAGRGGRHARSGPPGDSPRPAWCCGWSPGSARSSSGSCRRTPTRACTCWGRSTFPLGSIAILLLSIAVRRTAPSLAGVGVALAGPGLLGPVLSAAGQLSPGLYLGLGVGGSERLAGYPGNLWMLVIGVLAVNTRRRPTPGQGTRRARR
jgi:hypothetical protein